MDTVIYMGGSMAPTVYVSEECLIWHQREGRHLVLWRLIVPVKEEARGVRPEWVGICRVTLLESKGKGGGMQDLGRLD